VWKLLLLYLCCDVYTKLYLHTVSETMPSLFSHVWLPIISPYAAGGQGATLTPPPPHPHVQDDGSGGIAAPEETAGAHPSLKPCPQALSCAPDHARGFILHSLSRALLSARFGSQGTAAARASATLPTCSWTCCTSTPASQT
jgi:hypothetical protein